VRDCLKHVALDVNSCIALRQRADAYPAITFSVLSENARLQEDDHVQIIKLLISRKATPNTRGPRGYRALHLARTSKVAKLLIESKATIDAQTDQHLTPLMLATSGGRRELVQLLLDYGANYDLKNKDGKTALEVAPDDVKLQAAVVECRKLIRAQAKKKSPNGNAARGRVNAEEQKAATTTTDTSTSKVFDISDKVDVTSIFLPGTPLLTLQSAIDEYLSTVPDMSLTCKNCSRAMVMHLSVLPKLLVLDFANVLDVYGSTAQALDANSVKRCQIRGTSYRLVGIVYWWPYHFVGEFVWRSNGRDSFYYYDDLNDGRAVLIGDSPGLKRLDNNADLRGHIILMFYLQV
jgi:hypothetical protein